MGRGRAQVDLVKTTCVVRKTRHPAVDLGKGGLQRARSKSNDVNDRAFRERLQRAARRSVFCARGCRPLSLLSVWTRTSGVSTSSTGRMGASSASTPPPTTSGCSEDASVAMLGREPEPRRVSDPRQPSRRGLGSSNKSSLGIFVKYFLYLFGKWNGGLVKLIALAYLLLTAPP